MSGNQTSPTVCASSTSASTLRDTDHSIGSPELPPRASRRLLAAATSRLPSSRLKGAPGAIVFHPEDDTDSEIELFPTKSRKGSKRQKVNHPNDDENDGHRARISISPSPDSDIESVQQLALVHPVIKRARRIIDPQNAADATLIASTSRAGAEYYDSDADDLTGPIKGMKDTANHFRNVKWGACATDKSNDADFPTTPAFRAFVPGRFERLADGTAFDQKRKLIVKLTDAKGTKHIYANPPPRDWTNQDAITALNKKTVQQIRRNTDVKFRARVNEYVEVERAWILAHLKDGGPEHSWARFVNEFNKEFAGKVVEGAKDVRPMRSQSSLSKEVSGRKEFYGKGVVPVLNKAAKK
ncbi:hypothetical protein HBI67_196730 [Parastagonospora nodorum]|nr:hypothetical protein HBH50_214770 [Parastagonospora nodorum]KAH4080956.1 hypothetical protein HBH48_204220 [Parastagonospora nodorum]KAH6053950.1 hypothetical protein HBI66_233350 [Parastagonospora nodorum]KAH6054464.1 hypothetical protein HBI67_196730 [Parastagonospora nodorum]